MGVSAEFEIANFAIEKNNNNNINYNNVKNFDQHWLGASTQPISIKMGMSVGSMCRINC